MKGKIARAIPTFAVSLLLAADAVASLPRSTSADFAHGALFAVAGYDAGKPALSGFPVLVRIAENSPQGFSYDDIRTRNPADLSDIDIAFIDMAGNGLPFEIDTWNTNGTSLIWVRLPTMANGTEFVMCWGSTSSGKVVCGESPFSNYAGVWHMSEESGEVADSAGHGLAAMPSSATPTNAASGYVGNGRQCDSGGYLSIANANALDVGGSFAVSGWFSMASTQPSGDVRFFSRKVRSQATNDGWEVIRKGTAIAVRGANGDNIASYTPNQGFAGAGWRHLFVIYNGRTATIYENGVQTVSATAGAAPLDNDNSLSIGSYSGGQSSYFVGSVDECRLLGAVPSEDWAQAEYDSMAKAAFLTAGAAEDYEVTADPVAGVRVSDIGYTNATVSVSISSFGGDATSADVTVQLATSNDFAEPVWSASYRATQTGERSFDANLSYGTTYYVCAVLDNGGDGEPFATPIATFTTPTPGSPAGTATFYERGFTTLAATGTTTAFGTDAENAAMRLEASTDGFETVAAFSTEVVATIGEPGLCTISGLVPDTAYALRLRIRNDWGIDTFVALPDAATRAVPFATTGLGWTFAADGSTVDVTFGVSGIYDGATGTATLTYNGASAGSRGFSQAGTLSWPGLAAVSGSATATVVLSATLDGQTYSQTYTAPIAAGSTSASISDIMEHISAETAVRVRPGDVVTLPELSGTARYIVGNKLFGSLDGNVLTALRPGILGIHCIGNDSTTNTLAVLVLPEKIGNGDIYVFKDSSVTGGWCYWNDPARWEKLGSETNDSWPHNPDDIAIVAFYRNTGVQFDSRADDVVLGGLYAGGYCDKQATISFRCVTALDNVPLRSAIRFRRSDGEPVVVQLCSNSMDLGNNLYRTTFNVVDSVPLLEYASDTILSGGWDGIDARFPQGRFAIGAKTNAIPAGVTVELVEMDTQGQSMGCTLSITRLAGGGTFWNHSPATMRVYSSPLFSGLLRDSGGHGAGTQDRTAPTFVRTDTLTNAAAEVVGWVGRSGSNPNDNFTAGVGALVSGWPHFFNATGPHNPWFPAKGTTMYGGLINNRDEESGGWVALASTNFVENADGSIKTNVTVLATLPDKRLTDFLDVARGFVFLRTACTGVNYPTTWFEAADLRHGDKATLYVNDSRVYGTGGATNTVTILHGVSAHAVGGAGDSATDSDYPIAPWIATQAGPKAEEDMRFAAFDGNGLIVPIAHAVDKRKSLADYGANDNAYLWQNGISLSADTTFNSLSIANDNYSKQLGEGRTLTLTSGGLILEDISYMAGSSGIGAEDGGAANGSLVLGDATHPAYVWARGAATVSEKAGPNEIWAEVTAPGGFVAAYTGNLILGGNQTGIGNEIAVNAGALQLGTATTPCALEKGLPIRIYANATLALPSASSARGQELRFDGAAGWFGKVDIPGGMTATCQKACWRDYPETPEWNYLPRGMYSGDAEVAEALGCTYAPDFISGQGVLHVLKDDKAPKVIYMLR